MTDELIKFTPEYIASCRKAKGGPWVFLEAREALDEIERLQSQLAETEAMVERVMDAADYAIIATRGGDEDSFQTALKRLKALVAEYRASKKESVE